MKVKSNNSGEFVSQVLQSHLQDHGIIHATTCSFTHYQNDMVKMQNHHKLHIIRGCLINAHMQPTFWENATFYDVYLIKWCELKMLIYLGSQLFMVLICNLLTRKMLLCMVLL